MNGLVKFAIAAIGGVAIGLFSAQKLINGYEGFFSHQRGPWQIWPTGRAAGSNPYVRAHFLINDRLPISQFEVNEFEASADDQKRPLDANCNYVISGPPPKTRWWSLYTLSKSDQPILVSNPKTSVHSGAIVFEPGGVYKINLSLEPKPGNWITPGDDGTFKLIFRYYNPVRSIISQFKLDDLPGIKRETCK